MTPVTDLSGRILTTLSEIRSFHCRSTQASPSASPRNPIHRDFLEDIRQNLIHFDPDKKERLKFSLERFIRKQRDVSDPEFCNVLERILALIENFKRHQVVLTSAKSEEGAKEYGCRRSPERRTLFEE
jgi:hypothetical protein